MLRVFAVLMLASCAASCHTARPISTPKDPMPSLHALERQLTFAAYGHILTNCNVWSPDGKWIVYDVRSDPAGSKFDGERIEAVNVETGDVQLLYRSINGAHCGVVTWHPTEAKVIFILGPENPTADYQYGPARRRGVIVDQNRPGYAARRSRPDAAVHAWGAARRVARARLQPGRTARQLHI
jgi:hypothetical protein